MPYRIISDMLDASAPHWIYYLQYGIGIRERLAPGIERLRHAAAPYRILASALLERMTDN